MQVCSRGRREDRSTNAFFQNLGHHHDGGRRSRRFTNDMQRVINLWNALKPSDSIDKPSNHETSRFVLPDDLVLEIASRLDETSSKDVLSMAYAVSRIPWRCIVIRLNPGRTSIYTIFFFLSFTPLCRCATSRTAKAR